MIFAAVYRPPVPDVRTTTFYSKTKTQRIANTTIARSTAVDGVMTNGKLSSTRICRKTHSQDLVLGMR